MAQEKQDMTQKVVNKAKSRARRKAKSKVRRLNVWTVVICVLALAMGVGAGIGAYKILCADDCFELVGTAEYEVELGKSFTYSDPGAKAVEFGRDISDKIEVDTNMTELDDGRYTADTSIPGRYYIKYTVDSPKYGEICRIRTFVVGGES